MARGPVMRVVFLLAITILGGVAGSFAGGYTYNHRNPPRPRPPLVAPGEPGIAAQFRNIQILQGESSDALDRHVGRQNWLIGGALAGMGVGFFGSLIASRLRRAAGPAPELPIP